VKVTRKNASDQMYIEEQERATFTPYVKVDTRIAYFWDYVDVLNEQDGPDSYFGLIEPVPQTQISDPNSAFFNAYLPEGFGWYAVKQGNDSIRRFIVATFECAIYERQSYVDREGQPVDEAAIKAEDTAEAPQEAAQSAEAGQEAEPTDEELRERATALRAELEQASPEAWAAYVHWYTEERQFPALDQLTGSALKGAVVKLERTLDEVRGG
jgi:hypothetical protein